MADIRWDESVPAGADSVGIGAGEIRSTKTALRTALDTEHVFPAASGAAGVHRLGSGRPFYGLQSAVSSSGTDSRMMITSDTSRLFGVGSGGTSFIGGPTVISAGSYPGTVPQRHYWVEEFGEGKTAASGVTTVSFPNSGFSGKPFVIATAIPSSILQTFSHVAVASVGAASFAAASFTTTGAQSSVSFFWRSIGSRVL